MASMVKGALGGIFDKVGNWADKPPEQKAGETVEAYAKRVETRRKVRYVALDLGIIALGGMALMMAAKGGVINPSYMEMMMFPVAGLAGGIGIAFLISDLMGDKNRRVAARIAMTVAPLLLAVGGALIMFSGGLQHVNGVLQYSLTKGLQNNSFVLGALLLASTPLAIGAAAKKLS